MLPSDAMYLSIFFSEYQNTRIDIRLKLLTTMKRPLILLLLVLIQLQSYDLVGANEEVGNQGKEEEEKSGKDGEKKKDTDSPCSRVVESDQDDKNKSISKDNRLNTSV